MSRDRDVETETTTLVIALGMQTSCNLTRHSMQKCSHCTAVLYTHMEISRKNITCCLFTTSCCSFMSNLFCVTFAEAFAECTIGQNLFKICNAVCSEVKDNGWSIFIKTAQIWSNTKTIPGAQCCALIILS